MKKKEEFKNVRTVIVFVSLVFFAIVASLLFKGLVIVKNSTFDPSHRYTFLIKQENPMVISLDPSTDSASVLEIKTFNSKVEDTIKIPIDGYVQKKGSSGQLFSVNDAKRQKGIATFFSDLLISYPSISSNMTVVDLARLFLSAQSIPSHKVTFAVINSGESDSLVSSLFLDQSIIDEKKSVSVVNGAYVSGLGASFEQMLVNMGINVVSVSTAEKPIEKTHLVFSDSEKPYTVTKMEKVLGISAENNPREEISDIILYLGKDAVKKQAY